MNTKRYRKRYSGSVSMNSVRLRESRINRGVSRHNRRCYPLFETWNSIYNYKNLLESIKYWNEYSPEVYRNVRQAGMLLESINQRGSAQESIEASKMICEECLSYLGNIKDYKKFFENLKIVEEAKNYILDEIDLYSECDRITENFKLLDSKADMNRLLVETCRSWDVDEAVYRVCGLMEDSQLKMDDFKSQFCITAENVLYGLTNLVQEYEVPKKSIMEALVDYHLINDGCHDLPAYLKAVREAVQASDFVPDVVEPYLSFLEKVNEEKNEKYDTSVNEHYDAIQAIAEYDQYLTMKDSMQRFYEASIFDQTKEWLAKIKLAPLKSVSMVKEAIRAAFVTNRLQDIEEGTHNALAIAFYCSVTLGAFTIGMIPGILGAVSSFLLSSAVNKQYLKDALKEWNAHKYAVEKKLRSTKDDEQKRKLSTYLSEVDKNINTLESEYEKNRDKTASELQDQAASPKKSFMGSNEERGNSNINPLGQMTPAATMTTTTSSLINKADKEEG